MSNPLVCDPLFNDAKWIWLCISLFVAQPPPAVLYGVRRP